MDEPSPGMRVGDLERREVDNRLRGAHEDGVLTLAEYDERSGACWAARTRADLAVLVADLPDRAPAPVSGGPPAAAAGQDIARRVGGGLLAAVVVGVVGYLGIGVLGADDGALAFGSRTVQIAPGQDRAEVGFLFGSAEVVVPDDARVRSTGTIVFGSVDCDLACAAGTREVVVDAGGMFGSVDIVRQSEAGRADD